MFLRDPGDADDDLSQEATVNVNDGIVTRLKWEQERYLSAVKMADETRIRMLASAHHIFAGRVDAILRDPTVQLPPLPGPFLENGNQPL